MGETEFNCKVTMEPYTIMWATGAMGASFSLPEPERVIYNGPATIVFWADGTKTVVKCQSDDVFDFEKGFLLCVAKKAFGNHGKFNDYIRKMVYPDG